MNSVPAHTAGSVNARLSVDTAANTRARSPETRRPPTASATKPAGTLLRNPQLAAVFRRIATEGPRAFYEGEIARDMVAAVATDEPQMAAKPPEQPTSTARSPAPTSSS